MIYERKIGVMQKEKKIIFRLAPKLDVRYNKFQVYHYIIMISNKKYVCFVFHLFIKQIIDNFTIRQYYSRTLF